MGLSIKTCYTVKIQKQLDATQDKTTKKLNIARERTVDSRLMRQTSLICLTADRYVGTSDKNSSTEVSGV